MARNIKDFVQFSRKIVAIGRNYSEHAKELGNAVPTEPFFFLKPTSSLIQMGQPIELPQHCNVHHEVELGLIIGKDGRDIPESKAMDFVEGYVLGIDVTARNLQDLAKKQGKPWSAAKGYDTFTPVGSFIPKELIKDPHNLDLWLKLDGVTKQKGNTSDMLFKIPQLLAHVSSIMRLERGDVILTGTPSGVGPMSPNSVLTAGLRLAQTQQDLSSIQFSIISRLKSN